MESTCPVCHVVVKPMDFFCYNCGKNLRAKPPSVTVANQVLIYLGSIFLPPLGIIWGIRYLRASDQKSKTVGVIAITLTVIVLVLLTIETIQFLNTINAQVGGELQNIGGF